jgi:hypothetical protein
MKIDRNAFSRNGWTVIRGLFSPQEFEDLRERVVHSIEEIEQGRRQKADLLGDPHMASVVYDKRLVEAAREILGGRPTYFGDSNYAIIGRGYDETKDATGYHRDNTDRSDLSAPDWQSPYTLIRFGLYLQDHTRHSGGLLVRNGTHNEIVRGWKNYLRDRYLDTAMGDVGVWNMRLQHAGIGRFWRGFSRLGIAPNIQDTVPSFMQSPRWNRPRMGVWVSYALDGPHVRRHVEYLYGRSERLESWQHSHYAPEDLARCAEVGLDVIDCPAELRRRMQAGVAVGQHRKHYQMAY